MTETTWSLLIALVLVMWLFRRRIAALIGALPRSPGSTHHWDDVEPGSYPVDVVGESHYQSNLARIAASAASTHGVEIETTAVLRPYRNPHDPEAVQVLIDGRPVGHLSRSNARKFRQRLREHKLGSAPTSCPAIITGGGTDPDTGYRYLYGVRLGIKRL